jgi:hypothetical protein
VGLLLGSKAFDIHLSKGDLSRFGELLSYLSGAYTCEEISGRVGLSPASVKKVIEQLRSFDLIYDYCSPPPAGDLLVPEVLKIFDGFVAALRFDMFRHPLFREIPGSESLFLATATEYFHLIRDAGAHIGIALDHAAPELRPLLSDYLQSERDHYVAFERPLARAFGGIVALDRLAPLAATESLLLKTRELARSDTLAYLACCSFAEVRMMSGSVRVPQHWAPAVRSLFEAFLNHAREDLEASHSSLLSDALALSAQLVRPAQAEAIFNALHEYKHYFDNVNSEILRVYSQPGASLPRLKQRWEDFLADSGKQAALTFSAAPPHPDEH